MDETHATHVRRELIHLVEAARNVHGLATGTTVPKIQQHELVGGTRRIVVVLHVHSADPGTLGFEPIDQMSPDESPRPAYQCLVHRPKAIGSISRFERCRSGGVREGVELGQKVGTVAAAFESALNLGQVCGACLRLADVTGELE